MRIDRMLAIVVMLLNRKSITAKELAERFEVSLRTVYRDIDAINEAGIPVFSTQGSGGGFSIMEHYKLNHQLLTMEDSRAILTALKGVNSTLHDRDIDLAMEKIRSLVPREKAEELDLQLEQFVVDVSPWGLSKQLQLMMQEINRAIITSHMVTIDYAGLKGEITTRTIEPMTLLFKGYNWYVFGYCHLRKDGRLFRLTRIKKLETLKQEFQRRSITFKDFTQVETTHQRLINLVLKFSPAIRLRVEEYFYASQIETDTDGHLIVRVTFPEDYWVYSTIMSFGEFVEVIEPEHIRLIIKDKAKKIWEQYET